MKILAFTFVLLILPPTYLKAQDIQDGLTAIKCGVGKNPYQAEQDLESKDKSRSLIGKSQVQYDSSRWKIKYIISGEFFKIQSAGKVCMQLEIGQNERSLCYRYKSPQDIEGLINFKITELLYGGQRRNQFKTDNFSLNGISFDYRKSFTKKTRDHYITCAILENRD